MAKLEITQVNLPIVREDGGRKIFETLSVEQIDVNRFRLIHSPVMVEGLAAGDEFELSSIELCGYKVVRRGGNLCVWLFFDRTREGKWPEPQTMMANVESFLTRPLIALGGYLDGGGSGSLVFTIPVTVGFAKIEDLFNYAQSQVSGSTWMFGNVYDLADGRTPLNWWISQ
jgi:hypothetical protein